MEKGRKTLGFLIMKYENIMEKDSKLTYNQKGGNQMKK